MPVFFFAIMYNDSMKKVKQYVQKKDLIYEVQTYLKGKKTLIIVGAFQSEVFISKIASSLSFEYECIIYDKECTYDHIQELCVKMKEGNFDSIIGFGGGKVLDVAKAIAYYHPCFLMVIPSSASMDGACSALSVLYHEDHSFDRFLYLDFNPDVVLVDSQIIFDAPFALLCAGMADALSSYYDVLYKQKYHEVFDEVVYCAKQCKKIYDFYAQVKKDYENGVLSDVVEQVIHINIYESAVAFENTDLEFSHVLANASTKIKGSRGMHGERVGVSMLFQLYLMHMDEDALKLYHMLHELSMPTSLKDLGIQDIEDVFAFVIKELDALNIAYSKAEVKDVLYKIQGYNGEKEVV